MAVLVATDVAARGLDIPNISCHLGCRCLDDPSGSADWEKGCHLVGSLEVVYLGKQNPQNDLAFEGLGGW